MTPDYAPLWYWVREREAIRIKKDAGEPPPWTDDEILRTYRFCNVRREDDRVTVWIRKNIREPFADHEYLWFMLCAARQINWPATLSFLIGDPDEEGEKIYPGAWPSHPGFDPRIMAETLNDIADAGLKVFTGAYIITAPQKKGAKKTDHVALTTLGNLWDNRASISQKILGSNRLEAAHAALMKYDGWGPFLAYQAIVDMRFTKILRDAPDRGRWAAAGPGTLRGLNRVHGRPVGAALSQGEALKEMREIYAQAEGETGVAMDFSDVPNILCETDKYLRVKLGQGKPRALYIPGRGA